MQVYANLFFLRNSTDDHSSSDLSLWYHLRSTVLVFWLPYKVEQVCASLCKTPLFENFSEFRSLLRLKVFSVLFFDTITLMPALTVPTFYYKTHLCKMEQNGKFNLFQFFQKQNRILLLKYFTYMKNVIFWGTSCWCSSKFDIVWGGAHKLQSQLLSPPLEAQFLSYINMMYLKRSHFLCR